MSKGIYHHRRFSAKQTNKLREIAGRSKRTFNFLDQREFEFLRSVVLDPATEYPEIGAVSKYWGFGPEHAPAKDIVPWLMPKLERLLGPHEVDFFAYQEAITPWKIHADIRWHESRIPYRVLLIPLDVEPNDGTVSYDSWPETNTVVFEQRNFLAHYPESSDDLIIPNTGQDHWLRSCDDPNVEALIPGRQIPEQDWNALFGHIPYEEAEGMTIDRINPWIPMSIMQWDNTALHAADDFLGHRIRTKRCFMIFTFLPE